MFASGCYKSMCFVFTIYSVSKCYTKQVFVQIHKLFRKDIKMSDLFLSGEPDSNRKRVLITGFGPFDKYKINPSWVGVKFMNQEEIENKYNIILATKQLAMRYDDVDRIVPQLWDNFQPDLTIHVGLNPEASCFMLERHANKYGYDITDTVKKYPARMTNKSHGLAKMTTNINVVAIHHEFNNGMDKLRAHVSNDAGRFVGEYSYYTSLCRGPTLFVHVPLDKYSPEELAKGLERILELCLKQF